MEDWSKSFIEIIEAVAYEVEQFFTEVGEIVEAVVEQVQTPFENEMDEFFQEFFSPFSEIYSEIEEIINETEQPINYSYTVEPSPEKYAACIGCRHYYGQAHGGNLLVCGMHPYGWDDQNCPDWEEGEDFRF